MNATVYSLDQVAEDNPVPHLFRQRIMGDQMLFAHVRLEKGCHVNPHHHVSEQIAYIVTGRVKWTLGEPGTPEHREQIVEAGSVIHLPSNFPHGVDALEDTLIIDILSPPGEMGVDAQGRGHQPAVRG
jgi:quercetin dioxygenase-like cupin family protein